MTLYMPAAARCSLWRSQVLQSRLSSVVYILYGMPHVKHILNPYRNSIARRSVTSFVELASVVGWFEIDLTGADAVPSCLCDEPRSRIDRA